MYLVLWWFCKLALLLPNYISKSFNKSHLHWCPIWKKEKEIPFLFNEDATGYKHNLPNNTLLTKTFFTSLTTKNNARTILLQRWNWLNIFSQIVDNSYNNNFIILNPTRTLYVFTWCNEHTRIGILILIVLNHMIGFHWKVHFGIIA